MSRAFTVRGPYADELEVGQVFDDAPPVTLTDGLTAAHRGVVGNRLRVCLDRSLASLVAGSPGLVSPALVWDVSIGQSTSVTQHVRANLFYRGLCFRRFPQPGDTLTTITTVEGIRETSRKPGRTPSGLVALHIVTSDQHDRPVLDYWRCAMLPLSSPEATTGRQDDLDRIGQAPTRAELAAPVVDWRLATFRDRVAGPHFSDLEVGDCWTVDGRDVVSSAPELARLTGNLAAVHHDAVAGGGRRLVYGGHTIGLALHQITRALPAVATVTGWAGCDHVGPVHEDDALGSTVTVTGLEPLADGGGLVDLRSRVDARGADGELRPVLDWQLTAVLA
ncbi:MaoC family dehydratase [Nocardioides panacihumi]|uniref:MaoC family dehydratase n=1 Tax=Nocardioides panacihumi TaxID=400774 RepID=A0ABN2QA87_9ACTN